MLSALTAAVMTIFAKIGLKNVDPTLATGIRSFFMFMFMLILIGIVGKFKGITQVNAHAFWIIVISAIFGALSWLFYFIALQQAHASKVSAVDRLSLVFVIGFSVLFLAEKLSVKLAFGTIFATIGIILISLA